MIVAIDGPAGSGKSTVARALSDRLDLIFLDTGAMYRSVTVECLRQGIDMTDTEKIIQVARSISISFGNSANGQTVYANGSNVTAEIRTPEVDRNVSAVAAIPEVREAMVTLQRRAGENGDVVAEGRDIGTVVFPEADVKVFLTADPAARAHRRAVQRQGGDAATGNDAKVDAKSEEKILEDIKARDKADSERKA
ncbi:MAG: (d)CMP kinase, partial [Atopobium sp.]|nr:(d)CMP kinase [Atopobium sp.]